MKKLFKEWRYTFFVALIIFVSALALRLFNLTILPVFVDEAIYIRWSQIMESEPTLRFLPLSDGKQPLFMWILMFLVKRFNDPLFVGRLLSVASGMGTLVGIFVLSFLLFKNKAVSLVSSVLWAVSPLSFFFDRMALVDSMLTMFGVWIAVFGYLAFFLKRLDLFMITGFILGFALLTKSPAIFFVVLFPTLFVFVSFPKKKLEVGRDLAVLIGFSLVAFVIGFAMYNILRLGPNFHLISQRNADYVWPLSHFLSSPLDPLVPHFKRFLEWLWEMGPSSIYILVLVSLLVNARKNWKQAGFLLAWGLVPVIIDSSFAKVLTARYILFSLPFIFIWAGAAFASKNDLIKKFLVFSLSLFVAQSLRFDYLLLTNPEKANLSTSERSGYLEEWTAGTGIKEVSEILKSEHKKDPQKQIVVGTEGYFGTLPDGLAMYIEGTPNIVVIGVGLDISEIPESLKEAKKAGNKTYLVANSSRLKFIKSFEESGLRIVASYKKADRLETTRELVKHGPYDTFYLFEII